MGCRNRHKKRTDIRRQMGVCPIQGTVFGVKQLNRAEDLDM